MYVIVSGMPGVHLLAAYVQMTASLRHVRAGLDGPGVEAAWLIMLVSLAGGRLPVAVVAALYRQIRRERCESAGPDEVRDAALWRVPDRGGSDANR